MGQSRSSPRRAVHARRAEVVVDEDRLRRTARPDHAARTPRPADGRVLHHTERSTHRRYSLGGVRWSSIVQHPRTVTFVCGTPHGGALDSTLAMAQIAQSNGVTATVIAPQTDPYLKIASRYRWLCDLAPRPQQVERATWTVADRLLRSTTTDAEKPSLRRAVDVPAALRFSRSRFRRSSYEQHPLARSGPGHSDHP